MPEAILHSEDFDGQPGKKWENTRLRDSRPLADTLRKSKYMTEAMRVTYAKESNTE